MEALAKKLEDHDVPFNVKDHQIMCYTHVINLSSGRVICAVDCEDTPLESNPISLGHEVVQAIQVSGQHGEVFDDTITTGNQKNWYKTGQPPEPAKLKHLQLLQDVHSQWDLVYYLLNRLCEMRPVFVSLSP